MSESIDISKLPRHVDISCVQAFHGQEDIERLAERAVAGDFVSAHVLPTWLPLLRRLLEGTNTLAGGPAGFPSGGSLPEGKLTEVRSLLDLGAQEIDVVANIGRIRSGQFDEVAREFEPLVHEVGDRVPLRAIIEVGHLSDEQIERASAVVASAGVGWVKSGTGWSGVPTMPHHIELMARGAADRAKLKAAGGIRSLDTVKEMLALGVERFGMNADVATGLAKEARGVS